MADSKLLRDTSGSVLVESTLVIPIFLVLVLGTIDVTYMLYEWALASKAAYVGARTAVVSNPVAPNIVNLTYTATQLQNVGLSCFNTNNCPSVSATVCTSVSCTNGGGYDGTAFTKILTAVQAIFCPALPPAKCRLKAQNITISYQTNGAGVVGQLYSGNTAQFSLPMNVTVSITGMTHQFYFIGPLVRFFGAVVGATPAIPTFASTMQSEDMTTN